MLGNKKVAGDKAVARQMRSAYRWLPRDPVKAAEAYGRHLFNARQQTLQQEERLSRSCFNVGLMVDSGELEPLTKRSTLISDTLLLSHGANAQYCELGSYNAADGMPGDSDLAQSDAAFFHANGIDLLYGMHCPDLAVLGNWILQAGPLLKEGLVWYLPGFSTQAQEVIRGEPQPPGALRQVSAVDYIIRNGRIIDPSGSQPVKDRLIHPVLQVDLPFIEGVTLGDFSKITVDDSDSYAAFRNFLRGSFLSMDQALNGEQTQIELIKLRLDIEDQVRAMKAEFSVARRKRAWAVAGAVAAYTSALLVAVNGPVLEHALTTAGLTTAGTFWGAITARVENNSRVIKSGRWYYVWILSKKSGVL
ncbi:hypothetical protein [Streptomyces sp. NPDC048650]|uniref:hypothetical protein n=1 Tax=Streptomyces sp. NPDC048650 TaxID=3365583 RepID=UPI0037210438